MEQANHTMSNRFFLLGLSTDPHLRVIFFIIFLIMYAIAISGNLLITIVVRVNPSLHSPMYFFLTNLSMIDISLSSSVVPVILMNTLTNDRSISFSGCVTQIYISFGSGATECIVLAVMAYDRYVAICRPLHYSVIMNKKLCYYLSAGAWSSGFFTSLLLVNLTFRLSFCRSHYINHYFCEIPPIIRIACDDTFAEELAIYITGTFGILCTFLLTVISYVHVISSILKIRTSKGRQKTFSTCASHLIVVTLYFGTITFMYLRPHSKSQSHYSNETDKVVSILYSTVTPMLNPLIYSVRNKDVKNAILNSSNRDSKIKK
ncbi:olfactory receptor 5AR1-like [Engystomops pustulosus]|uniref:olfactory receptor 5AR1-like n=1 Tax=Engystomops pustulosus TaxID=76066 RepID=UPI003AFB4394